MSKKMFTVIAVAALAVLCDGFGAAQTTTPAAPAQRPAPAAPGTPAAPPANLPKAPAPEFPPVNPKNFTAPSPSVDTVNSFLHAVWGMDPNRSWSVDSIEPTMAPGVVRVHVYVAEATQPGRLGQVQIFITPDGKHAIAGDVVNFGAHPFEANRQLLEQQANGPARGAASKDLEIVEFADLQCPHCKDAQSTMDQLAQDFPQAHIVFENLPLTAVHPQAMQAAEVGNCVRQAKGDAAFFKYADAVFKTQVDLTAAKADATLRAAVTAAGADPASVMACASKPAAAEAVQGSIMLATDLGITSTPTLVVNGRALPLSEIPYEGLKKVIVYQGQLDGITVHEQPTLSNLK